jgi:uncharacterized protein YijF (DUF1287 family)
MTTRRTVLFGLSTLTIAGAAAALSARPQWRQVLGAFITSPVAAQPAAEPNPFARPEPWAAKLIAAAESQIGKTLSYDPAYTQLSYPGGDVPIEKGVCTDVIIRAYRDGLGIDLQKLVHEDMRANFSAYPAKWGLKRADRNIDHRRVPNLMTYFKRKRAALPVSSEGRDYLPGDVVTMNLPGNLTHIVLVTHRPNADASRPLCVHNIGAGARLEDTLFAFEITGHYRWNPTEA